MRGYIIAYRLSPGTSRVISSKFCKELLGQETSSFGGRYRYHRHGLLDDIPHIRLIRGVIIIPKGFLEAIQIFVENYDVELYVREVTLTEEDKKILWKR